MKNLADRIANLSPERRALLELKLKQKSPLSTAGAEQLIRRRAGTGPSPLSFAQERIWFLHQLEPETPLYNIPTALRLEGALNVEVLSKALDAIVARHEVLRTTIGMTNGTPIQIVGDIRAVDLALTDLSNHSETQREAELQRILDAEARRPFDLSRDLMLRAALIKLAPAEHVLAIVTHHIATDGWSIGILLRELGTLYEAFLKGKPNPLPDLSIQYSDYALWKREWLQPDILDVQLSYWRQQLAGMSVLELPTDRARSVTTTYNGATRSLILPQSLSNQLKVMSRDQGVTLFMILLAAFQILLHRYSGQNDIVVGSPIAGRPRPEVEHMIGFFVNTLVLRTNISGNPTFLDFLRSVGRICLAAYTHQDLPFEKLVEELRPKRSRTNSPLFRVMFAHENLPIENLEVPGLAATPIDVQTGTAMFDLSLLTREKSDGLAVSLEYSTELFDDTTITRMLKQFQILLEGIVAGPNRRITELPLLTDAERHQLLLKWNSSVSTDADVNCIHKLFEAQVERTPDVVAVVYEDQQWTYRELNSRANQLAHYLIKLGAGAEAPVALSLERSLEMVVAILAILKSGAAYVPLDPAYPAERVAFMLEDIRAPILLTERRFAASLPAHSAATSCLDEDWKIIAAESAGTPVTQLTPEQLAYVIYTSGSTGTPKGVEITHGALANYIVHGADLFGITSADRVLQFASISFDTAAEEIFSCLTRGATLVLRNDAMLGSVADFLQTCAKWRITVLDLPTAYWHELTAAMFSERLSMPDGIRLVIIGGERATPERLAQWRASIGNRVRLCNSYGPSEATIAATFCDLTGILKDEQSLGEVPIGRPVPNVQVYVLDQNLNPVPIGIAGELFIDGAGLARGYLNRPESTAEKFIPNPFGDKPNSRLYRTGDLVRFRADGNLEFVGRVDHQVKIRGFRIETDEIETVLRQHPAVYETVVIAREDVPGDKRLAAYVVPVKKANASSTELRGFLSARLPHYMIPSAFVLLQALPLTPNGKIDRKALPPPDDPSRELADSYTAPRTHIEQVLARIWAEVLKLQRVGIHDNFFDLGGHSLLAVRLMGEIDKAFGKNLRLSALFQAPTIEQMATFLSQEVAPDSWSSLIALQPHGSRPPFFWVHGESSDAFLPRYLGPDQPVYGFMHQSLDGTPARYTSVEEIAAHYLSEMRTVQDHGPYFIGGYCFGGLVAWEMAQQLRRQNEEVPLLVFLEPLNLQDFKLSPTGNFTPSSQSTTSFRDYVSRHVQTLELLAPKKKLTYLWTRVNGRIKRMITDPLTNIAKKAVCRFCSIIGYPLPHSLRSHYILGVYEQAVRQYRIPVHPGRVTVFSSGADMNEPRNWQKLADGGLEIHLVPGNHTDVLKESNARVWAERLKACLDKAQSSVRPLVAVLFVPSQCHLLTSWI